MHQKRNKAFDSINGGAYKPASRRGTSLFSARFARVGMMLDIVDREKGCVGGGPGTDARTHSQTHLTTLSLLPSSGNRYAFVFGILNRVRSAVPARTTDERMRLT